MQKFNLLFRDCGAHERENILTSGLPNFQTVEETFNDDHYILSRIICEHAVKVEEHCRFFETNRQFVFWFARVNCATSVRDQLSPFVMNRDHHSAAHHSASWKKSHSEMFGCRFIDAALLKIRVPWINIFQRERERLVNFSSLSPLFSATRFVSGSVEPS